MHRKATRTAARAAGALALGALTLHAQGTFVNFEEPQVKPVAIAELQIGGVAHSYALVCNTPDNSIEIYEGTAPHAFVARVPVGLAPVSVRWNDDLERFYSCNFIGDSVTVVHLADAGGSLTSVVERTVRVGDEPTDIVFPAGTGQALVALHSRSRVAVVQASDLAPVSETILQKADLLQPTLLTAVKAPRTLATLGDGRFYALNTMGGRTNPPCDTQTYDVDLYVDDPHNPPAGASTNLHLVGGLGTTNTGFAIDGLGRRMFVVGGVAQDCGVGVDAVALEPLGFVQSHLWVVDLQPNGSLDGAAPVVVAEQALGGTTAWRSIDLNQAYANANDDFPVPIAKRVSQPTDVVLVESQPGTVERIVIACFGSDKVLVLSPNATNNGGYLREHVDLTVNAPASGYGAVGPRGLAYDAATGLVWVANRLDQSLAVFSPAATGSVTRIQLHADPTPTEIRTGRPFLYSAQLTSGSHMVACASCHVDARTDGLQWNLGFDDAPLGGTLTDIPAKLIDNVTAAFPSQFPTSKGVMITQTLQGLVNSHLESQDTQYVTSNAPYHWRGDKGTFQDFNEAFHRLQGLRDLNANTGLPPIGISAQEMDAYAAFINTVLYPPNPEQPRTRVYGGGLGSNPDDLDQGSGALYGLKLYHVQASMGELGCVHCHSLPEGSSNTMFLDFGTDGDIPGAPFLQNPRENAAVRGLFQREKALVSGFDETRESNWTRVAEFGLTHDGLKAINTSKDERSINDFDAGFQLGNSGAMPALTRLRALNEFMRQFDWGVAPIIGWVQTVDSTHAVDASLLADMRAAVEEANAGLAVYVRTNGSIRGYYYDVSVTPAVYRRAGGATVLTETQLLALVTSAADVLIFQSTPVGSERRVAHVAGNPDALTGLAPSSIQLLPMVPSTSFVDVTRFTTLLDPTPSTNNFQSLPSILALRALETAARNASIGGVAAAPRHEPPRRLRVTGFEIRHGAKLHLGMDVGTSGSATKKWVVFDLSPTKYRSGGQVVWESAEELDPKMTMEFLNGGSELSIVRQVSDGDLSVIAQLNPAQWDAFTVKVVNQDATTVTMGTPQPLTIADVR